MSWKQFVREIERASRRAEKARTQNLARRQRELEKAEREHLKALEKEELLRSARNEVARFEEYLVHLHQLHHRCDLRRDWASILASAPPEPPVPQRSNERAAREDIESYKPGLYLRLVGRARLRRRELAKKLATALKHDETQHRDDVASFALSRRFHASNVKLARAVLAMDPQGFAVALEPIQTLRDFEALGLRISIREVDQDGVAIDCDLTDADVVPTELVGLTKTGKISTRKMPKTRYWDLYQDFVCSCVLRIARETFGVLPVDRVVVNMRQSGLNTATGHPECNTLLGAHLTRHALAQVRLELVDPSDCISSFDHRMAFKKSTGLQPVEELRLSESWVVTS